MSASRNRNLFDTAHRCFERYVSAEPHHHVAFALWALHAHLYHRFEYTPRLALLSPTPNAGRTTVLRVLKELVPKPEFALDPTAAGLHRLISAELELQTLLIDEVDNVRMAHNLIAVLNAGHQKGGMVPRATGGPGGGEMKWPVFAPVALAGIGTLPPALISRSIIVRMYRAERGK
jgi:hypothetical protein